MFCPACGASNPEHAANCQSCGQSFASPAGAPPTSSFGAQSGAPVNAHLPMSILVTLFCCQPCGIVAIVFSAIAMGKNSSADYEGAAQAAKTASLWGWIGFGVGISVWLIYGVFMLIMMAAAAAGGP